VITALLLTAGTALAVAGAPADPSRPPKAAVPVRHAAAAPHPARHRRARLRAPAVGAANAAATLEPTRQSFVNAGAVFPFAEGALYHVYTAPERVTDIALQPGEALSAVASGDTVRWVIGDTTSGTGAGKRTHILVKPFSSGLSTNLVVTTDRRTYHISLTSRPAAAMAAVEWSYPQDALIAVRRAAVEGEAGAPVAAGLELEQMHFGYSISGDRPAWRPLRAFDDGRQTFIEFPASLGVGEAPPLFLVDDKGAAQLVNYRLRGRFYVVDRLFDAAELRLGTKHQQVVRITRLAAEAPPEARRRRAS
jgi:type IV secretion system protein VirB9